LSEESFGSYLDTKNQPDPDLLIRPGERRESVIFSSGKLLIQSCGSLVLYGLILLSKSTIKLFQDFKERKRKIWGKFENRYSVIRFGEKNWSIVWLYLFSIL
jgi:hypothetical protein